MHIIKEIEQRRSIRKYTGAPVNEQDIEDLVYAATLAPSAKNRQPWKFIVYKNTAKDRLTKAMEEGLLRERDGEAILPASRFGLPDAFHTLEIIRQAPVLIAVLNTNGKSPYQKIDTDKRISEICDSLAIGAAIENMLLTATSKGLGTLWIANTCFAYPELEKEIGTKDQLIGIVAVGYPGEKPEKRPRKKLEEVLEYRE